MSQPQPFLTRWKKVSLPNKLTVVCTAVIAAATVWYAVTAHNQLASMQSQLSVTQQALADAQRGSAVATDQTWKAIGNINWLAREMNYARDNAIAASSATDERMRAQIGKMDTARESSERQSIATLNASVAASRNDQRAWVVPFEVTTETFPATTQPPVMLSIFKVLFRNTGKTPAVGFSASIGRTIDITHIPAYDTDPKTGDPSGLIAPNGVGNTSTADTPIPQTEVTRALRTGISFYIWGTIWYSDVFGGKHWTQFCYRTAGDNAEAFAPCGIHNTCDDCAIK